MNPLDILKSQLTEFLKDSKENEDFNEALHDCVYACNCSVTALEQHMQKWLNGPYNYDYCRGIKFVEDKWYQIIGMF